MQYFCRNFKNKQELKAQLKAEIKKYNERRIISKLRISG